MNLKYKNGRESKLGDHVVGVIIKETIISGVVVIDPTGFRDDCQPTKYLTVLTQSCVQAGHDSARYNNHATVFPKTLVTGDTVFVIASECLHADDAMHLANAAIDLKCRAGFDKNTSLARSIRSALDTNMEQYGIAIEESPLSKLRTMIKDAVNLSDMDQMLA